MKIQYRCYEVLKKAQGEEMTALQVSEALNQKSIYVEKILLKLAKDYPRIFVKREDCLNYFWWSKNIS